MKLLRSALLSSALGAVLVAPLRAQDNEPLDLDSPPSRFDRLEVPEPSLSEHDAPQAGMNEYHVPGPGTNEYDVPDSGYFDVPQSGCCPTDPCGACNTCQPCSQNACDFSCCDSFPEAYAQVEFLYLDRDNSTVDSALVINDITTDVLLTTGDLDFDFEPGVRVLGGYRYSATSAFEVSYFGINEWDASQTVVGAADLALPGDLGLASNAFLGADLIGVDYSSQLNNFEINHVSGSRHGISGIIGFRYLSLDEEFSINAVNPVFGTGAYDISTENDLFGGQVGARWARRGPRLALESAIKFGLFANSASQTQAVEDFGFPLRPEVSSDDTTGGFLVDLNLTGVYRLTDVWSARAGYNLIYIENLALAPNQVDFTDLPESGTDLHRNGDILMHGVNVGVEARF